MLFFILLQNSHADFVCLQETLMSDNSLISAFRSKWNDPGFDLQPWENKVELLFLFAKILILKLKSGSETPKAVLLIFMLLGI